MKSIPTESIFRCSGESVIKNTFALSM